MNDETEELHPNPFELNLRQRRLKVLTFVIIGVIAFLLIVSIFHPFFHPTPPAILTEKIRKALKVQALLIWLYYSTCLMLSFFLVIIAWLYTREVRDQLLAARKTIIRESTSPIARTIDTSPSDES